MSALYLTSGLMWQVCFIEHVVDVVDASFTSKTQKISGPIGRTSLDKRASFEPVLRRAAHKQSILPRTRSKTEKLIVLSDGDVSEDNQSHERDGDTAFSFNRAPGGAILVSGKDVDSLAHGELLRDGVEDALARHLW